jgi:diguanylate cyclase (GGDEF)-like protein
MLKRPRGHLRLIGKKTFVSLMFVMSVLFFVAALLLIDSIRDFYDAEMQDEARLVATNVSRDISSLIESSRVSDSLLEGKLRNACLAVSASEPVQDEQRLKDLCRLLDVDTIYRYDNRLQVVASSTGMFLGWEPPQGHPIRSFHESGKQIGIDEIRNDTETHEPVRYGYARTDDGSIVQVGIFQDSGDMDLSSLRPQSVIDQIAEEIPKAKIMFVDQALQTLLPTGSEPIPLPLSPEEVLEYGNQRKSFYWTDTEGNHRFSVFVPVFSEHMSNGTLVIDFDRNATAALIGRISLGIAIGLAFLFCIFCIFLVSINRKNRKILSIAYFDELTGLPNFHYFKTFARKETENRKSARRALLAVNPLNFKIFNSIYGYAYGDALLKKIASNLEQTTASWSAGSLHLFRFSDDRFIISASGYRSTEDLERLCEQIVQDVPGRMVTESVAIAVAAVELGPENQASEKALKEVSIALTHANAANPVSFYDESMGSRLLREEQIVQILKRVIDGEDNLFCLVYHPIVRLDDNAIVGFEALARLSEPSLGPIGPNEFIGVAERNHLIIPLGQRILAIACSFLTTLQRQGFTDQFIAVNVSALQLLDQSFVSDLVRIANRADTDLHQLELEITESVFSDNLALIERQLSQIRLLGIKVALDDFGTGYSSLSRLEELSIDSVKFDKPFIDRLPDPKVKGIAMDLISMVHHLGKTIVAEGVEQEHQRAHLLQMDCDWMQGYLYSKPMPSDQALQKLRAEEQGKDDACP